MPKKIKNIFVNIDPKLHSKLKKRCIDEGKTITALILELIQNYLNNYNVK